MRLLIAILVIIILSGCLWGAPESPRPRPDPCGARRVVVGSAELAVADDGGVYSMSEEGAVSFRSVIRRFDPLGRLQWSLPLDLPELIRPSLFAVGDALFLIAQGTIWVLRNGAVARVVLAPQGCSAHGAVSEGASLRVVGGAAQGGGCTYLIARSGEVTDSLVLGGRGGGRTAITASMGGYATLSNEALLRYDAAGGLLWQRYVHCPIAMTESAGAFFVYARLERESQLLRFAPDGQSQALIMSWPWSEQDPRNRDLELQGLRPLDEGVVLALGRQDQRFLLRSDFAKVLWYTPFKQAPAFNRATRFAVGGERVVLTGDTLAAFDLEGNPRWTAEEVLAMAVGPDSATHIVERQQLDECTAKPRVTTIDPNGVPRWTFTP